MLLGIRNKLLLRAISYRDDVSREAMRIVCTLHDSGELRVADPSLFAGGADRAWSDPDLDDVSTGEDQGFYHVASHHIASL